MGRGSENSQKNPLSQTRCICGWPLIVYWHWQSQNAKTKLRWSCTASKEMFWAGNKKSTPDTKEFLEGF